MVGDVVIWRFIQRPRAHLRYWCWLSAWHLRNRRDRGNWENRWWVYDVISLNMYGLRPRLWLIRRAIERLEVLLLRLRGPYSHRSDFTDKEHGVLHGGKGWSKQAFDDFVEEISLEGQDA